MTLSYAENVGQNFFQGISVVGDENTANYLMCLLTKTEAFRNKLFFFTGGFTVWNVLSIELIQILTSEKFGCFDGSGPKAQVACLNSVL